MTVDPQRTGLELAAETTAAFEGGDLALGAALADDAAAAFLAEQGEPNFDAPNMLRLRADALLTLGDHAAARDTLDRADAFAAKLPAGEPFDRLRVHLGRLRGLALLDGGDRPAARTVLTSTLEIGRGDDRPGRPRHRRGAQHARHRRQVHGHVRRRRRALRPRARDLRDAPAPRPA